MVPASLPGGGLSPGTFTGQVLLKTAGDLVSVPVTVVVGDSVFRQSNALNFTKLYEGGDPLTQVITFASTGSPLYFYVNAIASTGGGTGFPSAIAAAIVRSPPLTSPSPSTLR